VSALTIHGIPVLPSYRKGGQLLTWCEPEHLWHYHGASDSREPEHRVEHCVAEESPYRRTGYYLLYAGSYEDLPDDLRRERKRLDRSSRRRNMRPR
jgi:hypothetical protein